METLKFRTNIDCVECLNQIRSILDNNPNVNYWYIEPLSMEPELTITGNDLTEERVIQMVHDIGFEATRI